MVKIFKRLPLIRKFFLFDSQEVIQLGKLLSKTVPFKKPGLEIDDMSCCVLTWLLIIFLLN